MDWKATTTAEISPQVRCDTLLELHRFVFFFSIFVVCLCVSRSSGMRCPGLVMIVCRYFRSGAPGRCLDVWLLREHGLVVGSTGRLRAS